MKTSSSRLLVIMISLMVPALLFAQDRSMLQSQLLEKRDMMTPQPALLDQEPLEEPLDPLSYRVGGGDRIHVQIETVPPLLFTLIVGAEGYLLVPTVGKISTKGMTLAEAEREIGKRVSHIHRDSPVSVSLAAARRVMVHVRGSAVNQQSFEATASDRVSSVLADWSVLRSTMPYNPEKDGSSYEPVSLAKRSILLRQSDGTDHAVDLDQYYATGDNKWNPHVAEGDEIIANVFDESLPSVAIGGAVWLPGKYQHVPGDIVRDLVAFARGYTPLGRSDSVILARHGAPLRTLDLASEDTLLGLVAGDRIWVPSQRTMTAAEMVSVMGEVHMPGVYPLLKGETRLSELLSMAGGPTDGAMLHAATLHRTKISPQAVSENRILSFRGNSAVDDTTYVRQENELRMSGERVNVDFRKALSNPGSVDDPVVEPGDRIVVPRRTGTVYIFGQVVSPGHVSYGDGTSFDAYVRSAGGYTDRAKAGDAVVIKYGSRQWLDPSEATIEEGDAIWVPKEVEQTFALEAMAYGQFASILSSVATLVLVISQLAK